VGLESAKRASHFLNLITSLHECDELVAADQFETAVALYDAVKAQFLVLANHVYLIYQGSVVASV
jgi:hypothetical protein